MATLSQEKPNTINGQPYTGFRFMNENVAIANSDLDKTNVTSLYRQTVDPNLKMEEKSPDSKPIAVVNSNLAREKTTDNLQKLNQTQTSMVTGNPQTVGQSVGNSPNNQNFQDGSGKSKINSDNTGAETGNQSSQNPFEQDLKDSQTQIDTETQQYTQLLDNRLNQINVATASAIADIKTTFERRKREQEELNKVVTGGLTTAGFRSGRTQYANEIQSSILSAEERRGIQAISDLNSQELQLINQAQQASDEKSFALLNEKMNALSQARKEKNALIMNLHSMALENERLALQKSEEKRAGLRDERDQIRLEKELREYEDKKIESNRKFLVDNDITQPYYRLGNLIIDSASGNPAFIQDGNAIKDMEGGIFENAKDFFQVAGINSFDQIQALQKAKFNKDNIFGSDKTGYFNIDPYSGKVTQLTDPVIDPVDSLKGIEYGIIGEDKYGNKKYGWIDKATGTVTPTGDIGTTTNNGNSSILNSTVESALDSLGSWFPPQQYGNLRQNIDSKVSQGDFAGVKEDILGAAIAALPSDQKNAAFGRNGALSALDNIESLLNEYQQAGGNTNLLTGTEEQIRQKIGETSDPRLAQIMGAITLAMADYRRSVSGAAFTESESKTYENLFPSVSNNQELNQAKIQSLKNAFNRSQKSALSTVLGAGNYDAISNLDTLAENLTLTPMNGSDLKFFKNPLIQQYPYEEIADFLQQNPSANESQVKELVGKLGGDFSQAGNASASTPNTEMRTDRHNNPTAFTTDIARIAGLKEGVDYTVGDPFPNDASLKTARLLGDPIAQTIKVIDRIGFKTQSGKSRWTYIDSIPETHNWSKLSYDQKKKVIQKMYQHEGGSALKQYFV